MGGENGAARRDDGYGVSGEKSSNTQQGDACSDRTRQREDSCTCTAVCTLWCVFRNSTCRNAGTPLSTMRAVVDTAVTFGATLRIQPVHLPQAFWCCGVGPGRTQGSVFRKFYNNAIDPTGYNYGGQQHRLQCEACVAFRTNKLMAIALKKYFRTSACRLESSGTASHQRLRRCTRQRPVPLCHKSHVHHL